MRREESRVLLIDVQEKFRPHLPDSDRLIENCRRLLEGARLLGVPAEATEQYPQGLGATVQELSGYFQEIPTKLRFSSAECLNWGLASQREDGRFKVVLCGIETHVCIAQTAYDLMGMGYQVFLPVDALSSRFAMDHQIALERLRDAGAVVSTTEAILFEWCEQAGTEEFKKLRDLVKIRR